MNTDYRVKYRPEDRRMACTRLEDAPEDENETREIASHLILSVLSNVKDSIEDITSRKCPPSDKSEAIVKALGILIDLYEGSDESFDIYDYFPQDGDPHDLTEYITERLLEA